MARIADPNVVRYSIQKMRREDRQAEPEPEDVHVGDAKAEHGERCGLIPGVELDEVVGEEVAEQALDAERKRIGDQHRQRLAVVLQRPDEHQLEHDPEREHRRHRDDQAEERVDVQRPEQREAEVGAEDHQRAVADVDDPHDAEDQRQPRRHQRVHATGEDAEDDRFQDEGHSGPPGHPAKAGLGYSGWATAADGG